MRLDKKILKRRCREPLPEVIFLNLSGLNLDILEHLGHCEKLQWLLASDNALQGDEGISRLKQLWYLDLSNNQIKNVITLSKFLALGTLILSNNNLKWSDLERLSHAHIMSLSLHGNPQMDSDPYYRIHVIDSLPLIWELDGRLVTVTERLHVKQFFIDTQFTEHPVRHKTCRTFQTTSLKNIGTEGIVSKECKYIYSKFPMSEKHTKHTDERRLKYLANMVQEDILEMLDQENVIGPMNSNFLNDLIHERYKDVERCNMVLLLLVITLEFNLPTGLVRAALVSAQLDLIGSVSTMALFLLPRHHRSRVVSVLLNAAKVDRDNNIKNEGGLYPQLFMCLYHTVAQLTRIRQTSRRNMDKITPISHKSDYMALMASEAVSLLVQNTKFMSYFNSGTGVVALVTAATGSVDIVLDIKDKLLEAGSIMGGPDQEVSEAINNMILHGIENRLSRINIKMEDIPVGDRYLSLSDSLPIKPLHSVIWASTFLSKGLQVPRTDPPILRPAREALKPKPIQPKIGEKVLLGPQVVGELTMLMEGDVAMARIDEVPVANGAVVRKLKSSDAHFTFVDMKSMCFGRDIGMWRPIKTTGDKYSIHSTEANEIVKCNRETSVRDEVYTAPLIYTPKEKKGSSAERMSISIGDRPNSSMTMASASRRLSVKMVRRVMSADDNSNSSQVRKNVDMNAFRQSLIQDNFMDNNNMSHQSASVATINTVTTQSKRATSTGGQQTMKRIGSGLSCSSLHQHDNVHYIHGFTPREDSSRSNTVSILTTPATTERLDDAIKDGHGSSDRKRTLHKLQLEGDTVKETDEEEENPVHTSTPKEEIKSENDNPANPDRLEKNEIEEDSTRDINQRTNEDKEFQNLQSPHGDCAERGGEGEEGIRITDGHCHTGVEGQSNHSNNEHRLVATEQGLQDSCPICIAVANGSLVRVDNMEGDAVQVEPQDPVEIPQVCEKDDESSILTLQEKGKVVNENVNGEDDKLIENVENIEPADGIATKTAPSTSGCLRISTGNQMIKHDRPKSAVESYNYYVIQHPQVFASGTSAKMNERSVNIGFKTDFQQQREEAWRRTTGNRRQRPLTATIMTTSQIPPPQRPSSPSMQQQNQLTRNQKLKITKTDRWLGGGRDLYWESVRKRPKSGHTPGWKEGLPESMRKKRPMSAFAVPLTSRQYMTRSVMSVGGNYQHPEFASFDGALVKESGDNEGMLFMPHARGIQPTHDLVPARQLTTPVSEDGHRPLLVEGAPPSFIPNPSKRYSTRYNMMSPYTSLDYVYEDDEEGYEGRPSSHLSFNNDPEFEEYSNTSANVFIPSKNGSNTNFTNLLNHPKQTDHIVSQNSGKYFYKLCSLHKEIVFPYYAGTVVFE